MCLPLCVGSIRTATLPHFVHGKSHKNSLMYKDSHKCPSYLSGLWGFMEGTCLYAQRVGLERSRPILLCLENQGLSTVFLSAPSHTLPFGHSHGHSFQWSSSSLKLLRNSILRWREKWLCVGFSSKHAHGNYSFVFPPLPPLIGEHSPSASFMIFLSLSAS